MAAPPFDILQAKPAIGDIVSQHPADERNYRDVVESFASLEHDMGDASSTKAGRHKFGVGNDAARNAITTWVVGSLWLNTKSTPITMQRVVSVGPVVWEDITTPAASTTEVLTGTDASKAATPDAVAALWEKGSDITAAATISIGEGGYFFVTGNTGITDIDWAVDKAGRHAILRFTGTPLITNGANLPLIGGANIQIVAGDIAEFVSEGSDVARMTNFVRQDGRALVPALGIGRTDSGATVTIAASDHDRIVRCTNGGAVTANLPALSSVPAGYRVTIINAAGGDVSVTRNGSDTFEGGGTVVKAQALDGFRRLTVESDGTNWFTSTRRFRSAVQTITSGGSLTLAHGLGATPRRMYMLLKNISGGAVQGYANNDEVFINVGQQGDAGSARGTAIVVDVTNLNIRYPSPANAYTLSNFTTGANFAITNTDWNAIFIAEF